MKKHISAITTLTVVVITAGCVTSNGSFTDLRDGKTYRTVRIGNLTWMAENLNFEMGESVCYKNDESNCQKYGRLYNWNDAMDACPAGWRVPCDEDWDSLALAVGGQRKDNRGGYYYWEAAGTKLKSKTGWVDWKCDNSYRSIQGCAEEVVYSGNGTDDFGFSAMPGGNGDSRGKFGGAGYDGYWWSATEYDATNACNRDMYNNYSLVGWVYNSKTTLFSLRCIEDSAKLERTCKPADDHSADKAFAALAAAIAADTAIAALFATPAPTIDTTWLVGSQFNPGVTYGSFTDKRDGKVYRTVEIGAQTWMAENLNFETGNSWCYDNNVRHCQRYGRLYSWDAAMAACPAGWRLPSNAEWTALTNAVGDSCTANKKLKSTLGWNSRIDSTSGNGTDDYGFSALPGGFRYSGTGDRRYSGRHFFGTISRYGLWWNATELDSSYAWYRVMDYFTDDVGWAHEVKTDGLAVRCVKE